ncbi:hypothetical protein SETIT_9G222500v2 [Setaria italica]|uniref:Uncharacterized protein n=1 Tax=Setaria italica TaxID=4555 RepID=A0A368SL34_SETIT|nr:hypothetical protein SETIT_9G222500v2 [Setaria italica]
MFRRGERLGPSARRGARYPGFELNSLGLPRCGGGHSSLSSMLSVGGEEQAANCLPELPRAAAASPPGPDLIVERGRELKIELFSTTGHCSIPLLSAPPQLTRAPPAARSGAHLVVVLVVELAHLAEFMLVAGVAAAASRRGWKEMPGERKH